MGAWNDIDTNKNGTLSFEEAKECLKNVLVGILNAFSSKDEVTDEACIKTFKEMDVDGNGELSKKEFCDIVRIGWFQKCNKKAG